MQRYLLFLLLAIASLSVAQANTFYPFENVRQEAQFDHLLKELRCLVCQNQDLADSQADMAKDLRAEVYDLVKAGKSDAEIMQFLQDRFGDFILYNPPLKAVTYLLWFGPFIFLLLGLFIFWRTCYGRNKHV